MDRQQISPAAHEALMDLAEKTEKRPRARRPRLGAAALAACCALVLGIGVWKLAPAQSGGLSAGLAPGEKDVCLPGVTDSGGNSFTVEGAAGEKLMFPNIPWIYYQEPDMSMDMAASIALPEGSFQVELTREQIQGIFWGPEGKPEAEHPKNDTGDLPWMLFWGGYTLTGRATYDGEGQLFWLHIWGERPDGAEFTLELAPGRLPPSCLVEPGLETSDVFGVEVTGWSRAYDRNGDEVTDYVCGSEFMAGDVGVRFENVGAPFQVDAGDGWDPMAAARRFNALFVRQALAADGGIHMEGLLTNEDIPAWREERFSTLAQARQETAFAPYLPTEDIPGYGAFFGRLSYQEGRTDMLFVRWSRGYDDVEVDVWLDGGGSYDLADVSDPASYDLRLYEIPLAETVPEEYRDSVWMPTFRAEDMSLEIVQARGSGKDTGGMSYRFQVLHGDGALVEYHCDGLTAEQVWALVAPTLP